jgi:hypothetical protein
MRRKPFVVFIAAILLLSSICLVLALPTNKVEAQFAKTDATDKLNPQNWDERDEIPVPAENVRLTKSIPIGKPTRENSEAPTVVDSAAIYSNVTTYSGSGFANNNGTANTGLTITRLVSDDVTFSGTPPYSVGAFVFCVVNLNSVAVSARPRVRFYTDVASAPATYISGFSFNPISFPATSNSCFTAQVAPVPFTQSANTAGITFDNVGGTATSVQLDSLGLGLYTPPDIGTSTDNLFRTTATGSFVASNIAGALLNFSATPVANAGWEFRAAATISSQVKANSDPRTTGGTAQWTVSITGGTVVGLTPSNFALAGTAATGSTITSVVPSVPSLNSNKLSPSAPTTWTVTASIGSTAGTLGLNFANFTNLNTSVSNTLPAVGEVYTVLAPSAAPANVTGRLNSTSGKGLANANVSITNASTGEIKRTRSNQRGYFNFQDLEVGNLYIIEVQSKRFVFNNYSFTLNEDLTDLVLTAQ